MHESLIRIRIFELVNGKFQRCPSLQGIAARDCPGEEQDVINKRLDMSEVERIRTEIGEHRFLDYANSIRRDVVKKMLEMSEVERIRTEIGEQRFLDYANSNL
jgi:hypothetical protein